MKRSDLLFELGFETSFLTSNLNLLPRRMLILLCDFAPAYSPSCKELFLSSQEVVRFSGYCS